MRHVKFITPIIVFLFFASIPVGAVTRMPIKAAPAKAVTSKSVAVKPLLVPKPVLELPSFPTSRVKRIFGGTEAQRARGWLRALSYLSSDLNFFFGSPRFHDFNRADLGSVAPGATEPVAHEINSRIVLVYDSMAEIIGRLERIGPFLNSAFPMSETSRYRLFTDWLRAVKQRAIDCTKFYTDFAEYASFGTYGIPESDPRARIQWSWESNLEHLRSHGQPLPVDDSGNTITRWSDYCDIVSRGEGELRDVLAEKLMQIGGTDPRPIEPPIGTLL